MRFLNKAAAVLLALWMLSAVVPEAWAGLVPSEEETGSLTVRITCQGSQNTGGRLTLYRVGDINRHSGFVLNSDFTDSGADLSCESSAATAEKLAEYAVKQSLNGDTQAITGGQAVIFQPLNTGLYLVLQTQIGESGQRIKPFLVGIPMVLDGECVYHVEASPKTSPVPKPDLPEPPSLPQTGQMNWPIPVLALLGSGLLTLGLFLRFDGGGREESQHLRKDSETCK